MSEAITKTRTIDNATGDYELDAIIFIKSILSELDTEARWRVLEYCDRRVRSDTYGSEKVAKG